MTCDAVHTPQGNGQIPCGVVLCMTTTTTEFDQEAMIRRIRATWNVSTEDQREQGAKWYNEAQLVAALLAAQTGHTLDTAAAVLAHLSPRTFWAKTVQGATSLMIAGVAPGHLGANVRRALGAMEAEKPLDTLHGPKVAAFAANILGDTDAVTVDVWALRVALGPDAPDSVTPKQYRLVADAYRAAAREAGVTPATIQATTWIVARNGRAN